MFPCDSASRGWDAGEGNSGQGSRIPVSSPELNAIPAQRQPATTEPLSNQREVWNPWRWVVIWFQSLLSLSNPIVKLILSPNIYPKTSAAQGAVIKAEWTIGNTRCIGKSCIWLYTTGIFITAAKANIYFTLLSKNLNSRLLCAMLCSKHSW